MNQINRTTILDLAQHCGVSKGTVSRALNGYPDISDRTRRRIETAAKTLGYQPMGGAQGIRTGRTRSLGLVLQIDEHDGHRAFLTEFLAGLSEAASAEHWSLTVATATDMNGTLETMQRLTSERKADGFILPRTLTDDPRADLLSRLGVPYVLFGRVADADGAVWYDLRGEDAMRDAVLRLAALGHKRIGFIGGGAQYSYSPLRAMGYRNGLRQAGLEADPALEARDAMTEADGAAHAAALLDLDAPPTAIVTAVDRTAFGVYRVAAERGLTIGQDLSVISYDGLPEGALMKPPLTTYSVDMRQAGARLATLLIALVRGANPAGLRETEAATLLARGSDRPPVQTALKEQINNPTEERP